MQWQHKWAAPVLVMVTLLGLLVPLDPKSAQAAGASLLISPAQGQYSVDSTFEVSILVNTGGQSINAVEALLSFPADKLQVVNPAVSKSFIEIWTGGPSFSNTSGRLTFQGGIPSPGVTTSSGVISTIQFRAKSAGRATIKFLDGSKILANDGQGTNILTSKSQATFDIKLAPPSGPIVTSPTHDDQNKWYRNKSVTFQWEAPEGATDYSYVLDTSPSTIPNAVSNTTATELSTEVDGDGIWYFHLRAKNAASWGGTTHFSVKIDATAPAGFTPQIDQKTFAENNRQLVTFTTTDAASGIDHYEIRLITDGGSGEATSFFTEAQSPYQLPNLPKGKYSLIVRAFDAAGNYTDGIIELNVVAGGAALAVGRPIFGNPVVSNIVISLLALILLYLLFLWLRHRQRNRGMRHLQTDLVNLKQLVAERQTELSDLVNLENSAAVELQQIANQTPTVMTDVAPPVPPAASTERDNPGQFPPAQQL